MPFSLEMLRVVADRPTYGVLPANIMYTKWESVGVEPVVPMTCKERNWHRSFRRLTCKGLAGRRNSSFAGVSKEAVSHHQSSRSERSRSCFPINPVWTIFEPMGTPRKHGKSLSKSQKLISHGFATEPVGKNQENLEEEEKCALKKEPQLCEPRVTRTSR